MVALTDYPPTLNIEKTKSSLLGAGQCVVGDSWEAETLLRRWFPFTCRGGVAGRIQAGILYPANALTNASN